MSCLAMIILINEIATMTILVSLKFGLAALVNVAFVCYDSCWAEGRQGSITSTPFFDPSLI